MEDNKKNEEIVTPQVKFEFKYIPREFICIANPDDVLIYLEQYYEYVGLYTYRLKNGVSVLRDNLDT